LIKDPIFLGNPGGGAPGKLQAKEEVLRQELAVDFSGLEYAVHGSGERTNVSTVRPAQERGGEKPRLPDEAPAPDEAMLRELILYICTRCGNDPKFGSTKLNKLLFFSDFYAYANLGSGITNVEYQKLRNGPAPRRLLPIREEMIAARELGLQNVSLAPGYTQKRPVALRKPDLRGFSAAQISLVDEVISTFGVDNANEISDASHRMMGWKSAKEGEIIPYSTIFVSNEPLSEAEQERGLEIAQQLGIPTG
jgi:hypothetical protein